MVIRLTSSLSVWLTASESMLKFRARMRLATRLRTPGDVDDAIRSAQAVDGPALIWFEIAEEQNVFPMMPAGKGLSDLIEKWGGADE